MKILLFIVIFLLMNAFFIISNENLALKNTENIKKLFSSYYSWTFKIFDNLGQVTGDAVRLDWGPDS